MNWRLTLLFGPVCVAFALSSASAQPAGAGESAPYRAYIVSAARDGEVQVGPTEGPSGLSPLPTGWPTHFAVGHSDGPGGASETAERGLRFRYQYLAGGTNTGTGWASWDPNGAFVTHYIEESMAARTTPVFSYYMVRQSNPGSRDDESHGVARNLADTGTMRSLFDDLELFFERAAGPNLVVLHFEPDLWGHLQQAATHGAAASVPVSVASTGHPDTGGLQNSAAGLAQALIRLRDRIAPNVLLAYHLSILGTGEDPLYSDPGNEHLADLAEQSVAFYRSLGAEFDLAFGEMSDRDAGFKQHVYGDGGASWWDEGDFARHLYYLRAFVNGSQLRIVLWQIPQGNTLMRSSDNSWNHYQDNKVEWLLGDANFARLELYADAGVIGLLFGRGADGATCACDAADDGVTNPSPINGNSGMATSADDDGGYFWDRIAALMQHSPLPLR